MLRPRRQRASTITVTAPVGGWNSRDPLASMKPTDAVVLDNWFCTPTELKTRKGYSNQALNSYLQLVIMQELVQFMMPQLKALWVLL